MVLNARCRLTHSCPFPDRVSLAHLRGPRAEAGTSLKPNPRPGDGVETQGDRPAETTPRSRPQPRAAWHRPLLPPERPPQTPSAVKPPPVTSERSCVRTRAGPLQLACQERYVAAASLRSFGAAAPGARRDGVGPDCACAEPATPRR